MIIHKEQLHEVIGCLIAAGREDLAIALTSNNKKGFVGNIETLTVENDNFRKVLYTGEHSQLVVMSIAPKEDIGEEVHLTIDQFFRIEKGEGKVVINGVETPIGDGFSFIIPAGAKHNVINTGDKELKLYSIYSPANHKDGTIHKTKSDAKEEHFDGKTTEG